MSGSDHDSAKTNRPSAVLDDVIEDVANRLRTGDAVDCEAILAEYPEHAESLRRLFPAIAVMADFGVFAGRPPASSALSPGLSPLARELGVLGDFRILSNVGQGGMGIVYEAEQVSLSRHGPGLGQRLAVFSGAQADPDEAPEDLGEGSEMGPSAPVDRRFMSGHPDADRHHALRQHRLRELGAKSDQRSPPAARRTGTGHSEERRGSQDAGTLGR